MNSRTRFFGALAATILLLMTSVVAFVRQHGVIIRPNLPSFILLRASPSDDLKGLLDASSYESDVVKAYAGKTIKTAAKKSAKMSGKSTYDLSVDESTVSSSVPPPSPPSVVTPPVENTVDTTTAATTATPPPADISPSMSEKMESMAQSVKETISKSTTTTSTSSDDGKNPLEGIAVPSNVQEAMEKPFTSLNNILKSTQESIKEAQRAAAEQSTAANSASSASGSSSTSGKVPTMADYMLKSLNDRKAGMGVVTEKNSIDIKLPEISLPDKMPDVKLPDMPNIVQMPSVDKVVKFTPPSAPLRMTDITLPEPGKALTFGEYIRAKAAGALPDDGTTTVSTLADIKAKFAIMVANYYKLIGEEVPDTLNDIQFPNMQDISNLSNKVATFDFKQLFDSMPESAPWGAVALGTFLVVAGARKDGAALKDSKTVASQTMQAATEALGGLTEDLVRPSNFSQLVVRLVVLTEFDLL